MAKTYHYALTIKLNGNRGREQKAMWLSNGAT